MPPMGNNLPMVGTTSPDVHTHRASKQKHTSACRPPRGSHTAPQRHRGWLWGWWCGVGWPGRHKGAYGRWRRRQKQRPGCDGPGRATHPLQEGVPDHPVTAQSVDFDFEDPRQLIFLRHIYAGWYSVLRQLCWPEFRPFPAHSNHRALCRPSRRGRP